MICFKESGKRKLALHIGQLGDVQDKSEPEILPAKKSFKRLSSCLLRERKGLKIELFVPFGMVVDQSTVL